MIKILKLTTGEEVICNVENWDECQTDKELAFAISDPFQFGMGQQGLVMVPFMPLAVVDKMFIDRRSVVAIASPKSEVTDNYSRITGKILLMENQVQRIN